MKGISAKVVGIGIVGGCKIIWYIEVAGFIMVI